jgi:hypothetical protein
MFPNLTNAANEERWRENEGWRGDKAAYMFSNLAHYAYMFPTLETLQRTDAGR